MYSLFRFIASARFVSTGTSPKGVSHEPLVMMAKRVWIYLWLGPKRMNFSGRWTDEKLPVYDFETLDDFERLKIFEKPLLAALSRKSFIGEVLEKPATERLYGSLAAAAIAVYKGAHIIRTHDVPETFDIVKLSGALRSRPSEVKRDRYEVSAIDVKTPQDAAMAMRKLGTTWAGSQVSRPTSITSRAP